VIASLMVPAVPLALMADCALAAEPQMPEDFQGTWCADAGVPGLYAPSVYSYRNIIPCKSPRLPPSASAEGSPLVEIEGHFHAGEQPGCSRVLRSSQSYSIRHVPMGNDLQEPGAGAGSKVISDKPVGTGLQHSTRMHSRPAYCDR